MGLAFYEQMEKDLEKEARNNIYIWLVGWLVGFNGISTSIGYLMTKPVYTYVRFVNT